MRDAVIISL